LNNSLYYHPPVFRPPSEANSLLIQATIGCTYSCPFCAANIGKKFSIRPTDDIKQDLDTASEIYGGEVRRIFFLDGNGMIMPAAGLREITEYAYQVFGDLERVSVYAHAQDILKKTDTELKNLADAGLKLAYIGIESGDDELLKAINKHQTANDVVGAFHKCFRAGITLSGTIVLGLTGRNGALSVRHIQKTAELVNRASPIHVIKGSNLPKWYISCLALMIPPGTPIHKDTVEGKFIPMNADEILYEMKIFMENISDEVQNCIFRSNHASNYLAIKGTLSKDRSQILDLINQNLRRHTDIRPEIFRAL